MAQQYGVTPQGFVPKQQQEIITEINTSLQGSFGANINLNPESVFGQIVGIFSEREALLWQLGDAIYASQYPSGAEGLSVDNILALNNLKRLPATATQTNSAPLTQEPDGITLFGLVLFGTPGTVVGVGSIIQNTASPALSFTLNQSVTISAAVDAIQSVFFGNVPNTGAFSLSIQDPAGNTLTTATIPYTALANQSQISFSGVPSAATHFGLSLTIAGITLTTANISTPGAYPTSGAIQSAIQALTGYSGVTVSGSAGAYTISWGSIPNPTIAVVNNTTTVTISEVDSVQATINNLLDTTSLTYVGNTNSSTTLNGFTSTAGIQTGMLASGAGIPANTYVTAVTPTSVTISQAATATAVGVSLTFANYYPYTDVQVSGSFASTSFVFAFGSGSVSNGNPPSSNQQQALMSQASNTLENGATVTNINIVTTAIGAPAQGIGAATCTVTGPNFAAAGTLTVIGTPTAGWTGVTNQLDCITGTNVETDTAALTRRSTLLAAQANGPIQSIVEKVDEVPGVTAAIGFQNQTNAAQQLILFASVPVTGNYTLSINGFTSSSIAYGATASQVQTAIQAMDTSLGTVLVTGNNQYGFTINFNGSNGFQGQPLFTVPTNTTGVTISVYFMRPPKSLEIVVEGGANAAVAQAIYGSKPAGIQSFGSPTAITTGSATAGSTALPVASTVGIAVGNAIFGNGITQGATVVSIGVGTVTMSLPALGNSSSAQMIFNNTVIIYDSYNNPNPIAFSRPTQIPVYVLVALTTDTYNTPGVPASGVNPNAKFNADSIITIQSDIVMIGQLVGIGGLVIGFGTNGLIGAFNNVPGIVLYTLYFGLSPSPAGNANIQMQSEQQPLFETFNTVVSYV